MIPGMAASGMQQQVGFTDEKIILQNHLHLRQAAQLAVKIIDLLKVFGPKGDPDRKVAALLAGAGVEAVFIHIGHMLANDGDHRQVKTIFIAPDHGQRKQAGKRSVAHRAAIILPAGFMVVNNGAG